MCKRFVRPLVGSGALQGIRPVAMPRRSGASRPPRCPPTYKKTGDVPAALNLTVSTHVQLVARHRAIHDDAAVNDSRASSYLDASRRRIEIAAWHAANLRLLLDDPEAEIVPLQASFEGLFTAGFSAVELAAKGITTAIGQPSERMQEAILQLRGSDDARLDELGQRLARWRNALEDVGDRHVNVDEEAGHIRRAITHSFYEKRHGRPAHWFYEIEDSRQPGRFRSGELGVISEALASGLAELDEVLAAIAARIGALAEIDR
jgi:hypothetical protein